MKIAGVIFGLATIVLAIVAIVYGIIFGWQCFLQLFAMGASFETAKHALIVWISCAISAKIAGAISGALLKNDK